MLKKASYTLIIVIMAALLQMSCSKHEYPCPGLGMSNEADMSMFDEDGNLKDKKGNKKGGGNGRISHENGLVQKKNPKGINAPRKTKL